MTHRVFARFTLFFLPFLVLPAAPAANADSSHARIIRLSLLQGDVRFTRDAHGDPLSDANGNWEAAVPNLPIRQGYVIATDNGRAEVEFENGAMVFLNEHSVLEFYDLSLNDGALTTRLVLRQGTVSAYVHSASGDYFSVTGGDFTVEATSRASFRIDNFDDGSTVSVLKGRVSVLHENETSQLEKNQSLTMHAGADAVSIDRLASDDGFDHWVSGRIDSVSTATNASLQYVNSPYYNSGFSDLTMYGSWFSIGGFGNCWRPFGVGFGWSPFDTGSWFYDPFIGWSFIGYQPWGWAPYHYGSWIFSPGLGWVWVPSGFGYRGVTWRPVTAVWVHSGASVGLVPIHPTDKHGKTPVNITQGVLPVPGSKVSSAAALPLNDKWKVLKTAPREILASSVAPSAPPLRVSRTVLSGAGGSRAVTAGQDSSIIYDSREHRFVNANTAPPSAAAAAPTSTQPSSEMRTAKESPAPAATVNSNGSVNPTDAVVNTRTAGNPPTTSPVPSTGPHVVPAAPMPPPRAVIAPPPAPRASGSNGRGNFPAPGGSSGTARPAPAHNNSAGPAAAPRASSGPAPASRSSSGSGGRPR
ncbi:MAG: hypothetical protein NVS9B13_18120 [Candidatus Acidiferrum sp.]